MPGPVPKPTSQRRRRNKPTNATPTTAPKGSTAKWPNVISSWHPIAKDWYRSLKTSGQAAFYERSDVQVARFVAQAMSDALVESRDTGRMSASLVSAILSAQADLLTTEGARRRARVELERAPVVEESPTVAIMARYREAAAAK